ncbi:MAG: hypothetical protein NT018_07270, partial [Armatimonadetes bacterium]|nr:hypothetical protein [Armatimonadota bacterium]
MIDNSIKQLVTGNEFVSISDIATSGGGIGKVGFLHKGFRACVEMRGSEDLPLLKPTVTVDDVEIFAGGLESELLSYWIPQFTAKSEKITVRASVFAPLERRGFVCLLILRNNTQSTVKIKAGWEGCWKSSHVTANISRDLNGTKHGSVSSWKEGVPVIEFRGQTPMFAIALLSQEVTPSEIWDGDGQARIMNWTKECISAPSGKAIHYRVADAYALQANEEITIPLYVGIGLEEVSAVASAHELRLQGWSRTFQHTREWLDNHAIECDDPYFNWLININSFFNYFYSQGITLDTEEVIMTTSRNSLNEHCGAYMDRDAMRWSL